MRAGMAEQQSESKGLPQDFQSWRKDLEWDRKGIHAGSTVLALWTFMMHEPLASLGLGLATLLVLAVDWARVGSRRWALWVYRKFPFLFRRDERHALSGATVMMIGITLTSVAFPARPATAGILCLSLGDSAAALVGQGWSLWRDERRRRRTPTNREPVVKKRRRKTIAGTLGCFVVSMLMILLVMGPQPSVVILGGLCAALMERWTPGRWDNLTLPVATAWIIQIALAWPR